MPQQAPIQAPAQALTPQQLAQQSTQAALANAQATSHQNPYTAGVDASIQQLTAAQMQPMQSPSISPSTAQTLSQGTGSMFDVVGRQVIGHQQLQADQEQQAIAAQQYNHQMDKEKLAITKQQQLESGVKGQVLSLFHNASSAMQKRIVESGLIAADGTINEAAYTHQAATSLLTDISNEAHSQVTMDENAKRQKEISANAAKQRIDSHIAINKYDKIQRLQADVKDTNERFNALAKLGIVRKVFGIPPEELSQTQKKNWATRTEAMLNQLNTGVTVRLRDGSVIAMDAQSGNPINISADNPRFANAVNINDVLSNAMNNVTNFTDSSARVDNTYTKQALRTPEGKTAFANSAISILGATSTGWDGLDETGAPTSATTSLINFARQQILQGKVKGSLQDVIVGIKNKFQPSYTNEHGVYTTAPNSLRGMVEVNGAIYNINSSEGMDELIKHYQRHIFYGGKSHSNAVAFIKAIRQMPIAERADVLTKLTLLDTKYGWDKFKAAGATVVGALRTVKNMVFESPASVVYSTAKGVNMTGKVVGNAIKGDYIFNGIPTN